MSVPATTEGAQSGLSVTTSTSLLTDSDNGQDFNCTAFLNATNYSIFNTPTHMGIYIGLAIMHISFSIFPALLLATVAYNLISRLTSHPSKVVFHWICMFCIIGPCTYPLLMDISLFLDVPALGRCERRWEGAIYWLTHSQFETSLLWMFAFNAIMMYVSIRRETPQFNKKLVHFVIACIVVVAFLESTLWVMLTEKYVVARCKIRGSFCVAIFGGDPLTIVLLEWSRILIGVTPALVCVPVCLTLYWCKVKNNVINNQNLAHSLINLTIALLAGTFLCNLPTMLVHFATYRGSERTFISLATTYALQLNYLLYPLLILILHRDLRAGITSFCGKFCQWFLFRKITQVADSIEMQSNPNAITD